MAKRGFVTDGPVPLTGPIYEVLLHGPIVPVGDMPGERSRVVMLDVVCEELAMVELLAKNTWVPYDVLARLHLTPNEALGLGIMLIAASQESRDLKGEG